MARHDNAPARQDTFTCEMCGSTYTKGWSDEEQAAEAEALFGITEFNPQEHAVVCDYCFNSLRGNEFFHMLEAAVSAAFVTDASEED